MLYANASKSRRIGKNAVKEKQVSLGKKETKSAILRKYYERETFKTGTKVIITAPESSTTSTAP